MLFINVFTVAFQNYNVLLIVRFTQHAVGKLNLLSVFQSTLAHGRGILLFMPIRAILCGQKGNVLVVAYVRGHKLSSYANILCKFTKLFKFCSVSTFRRLQSRLDCVLKILIYNHHYKCCSAISAANLY